MQVPLDLSTLGALDEGTAKLIINAAINDAVRDVEDRGDDAKPRQVVILLNLKKMDNGLIEAHVEAEAKVPKRRTRSTIAKINALGKPQLMFQEFAPNDPHQRTIDEAGGEIHNP